MFLLAQVLSTIVFVLINVNVHTYILVCVYVCCLAQSITYYAFHSRFYGVRSTHTSNMHCCNYLSKLIISFAQALVSYAG